MKKVSEIIRENRIRKRMTQDYLEKLCGIPLTTISRVENRFRSLPKKHHDAISAALDIDKSILESEKEFYLS